MALFLSKELAGYGRCRAHVLGMTSKPPTIVRMSQDNSKGKQAAATRRGGAAVGTRGSAVSATRRDCDCGRVNPGEEDRERTTIPPSTPSAPAKERRGKSPAEVSEAAGAIGQDHPRSSRGCGQPAGGPARAGGRGRGRGRAPKMGKRRPGSAALCRQLADQQAQVAGAMDALREMRADVGPQAQVVGAVDTPREVWAEICSRDGGLPSTPKVDGSPPNPEETPVGVALEESDDDALLQRLCTLPRVRTACEDLRRRTPSIAAIAGVAPPPGAAGPPSGGPPPRGGDGDDLSPDEITPDTLWIRKWLGKRFDWGTVPFDLRILLGGAGLMATGAILWCWQDVVRRYGPRKLEPWYLFGRPKWHEYFIFASWIDESTSVLGGVTRFPEKTWFRIISKPLGLLMLAAGGLTSSVHCLTKCFGDGGHSEFVLTRPVPTTLGDVRPDANAMQAMKHQPVLWRGRQERTLPLFCYPFNKWAAEEMVVDLELASQLMAPSIVCVDDADLLMSMRGALRRYHFVNSDRAWPLTIQQDVNNNTLMFAYRHIMATRVKTMSTPFWVAHLPELK